MAEPAIALAETRFETVPLTAPVFEVHEGGGESSPPTGQLEAVDDLSGEAIDYPGVIRVSEIPGDSELVAEARRNIRTRQVGSLALKETVQADKKPIKNIAESIIWASRGDAEGVAMADANIGTETLEQAYKAGNVVSTRLQVDEDDIYQHGQRMSDIQANAYQLASEDPIIKPRTEAEANNAVRMKHYFDEGVLEDNVFIRFSMCPEEVPDEKLDKLKFFSSTKSMSVQTAYSEGSELVDEVAMVAGVAFKDAERHDRRMVERFARRFGRSYEGMSTAEILDNGLLIPKEYIKDGVIDVVRILEDGEDTFFGLAVSEEDSLPDYEDFKEFCEQRAARFDEDVVAVREQLIAEEDELITGRSIIEASVLTSRRLSKLVEQRLVDRALHDRSIDPEVFGQESAKHLIRARKLSDAGEFHEAHAFMQVARSTAKGGSCPGALIELLKNSGLAEESSSSISKENAWAGTDEPKRGTCVNCNKKTLVGVKSWCKGCIKDHCN